MKPVPFWGPTTLGTTAKRFFATATWTPEFVSKGEAVSILIFVYERVKRRGGQYSDICVWTCQKERRSVFWHFNLATKTVIWAALHSDELTSNKWSGDFHLDRSIFRSWQFCGDGDKKYIFLCVAGSRSP